MSFYDIISQNDQTTVVAQYERPTGAAETAYQSEADLEEDLVARLERQGYEQLHIHTEKELIANLRKQLETLNDYRFSDSEWNRFFRAEIANEGKGIEDKAYIIQQDNIKTLNCDDGTLRNIKLIDKSNVHANTTQVINQYEVNDGLHKNRYDVSILVNGLPLVHIELKRRGVQLKEAFNQINRYGRESFWAGCALYEYVQIFVISNGTETKYYSNTTRKSHVSAQGGGASVRKNSRTCNSFEFTSYWSDARNNIINDLEDFTATFLSRHTLLNVLTQFCVLTEQKVLMVMRPYQIAATENILMRIVSAHNAHQYGKREAGGYIWHTTGSGKTLTSFKAAQLATKLPFINKVVFVVDRKDLDYQTMKEYDRFEKGAANGNTSTRELERQIANDQSKIIITTIQKLSTFVKKNPKSDFYNKEVVLVFDECHRSQFGDMHHLIVSRFKKYYIFGFTGTPIFAQNASTARGFEKTTEDVFGCQLHRYNIVDAIRDHNVLPFRVSYVSTIKEKADIEDSKVWDIERDKALRDPRRIHNVAQYVLEHFFQQTMQGSVYQFSKLTNITAVAADRKKKVDEQRITTSVSGFNSIFAAQDIPYAKLYYTELKTLNSQLPEDKRLKIATIFSYAPNEQDPTEESIANASGMSADENSDSAEGLDTDSREFLERAIADYNELFHTNYDTSADGFPSYYKDVSHRMKNKEIDILVVVNMFLTGFDATTLNTLWVDKNLRNHGLLQAYSRTNRILNSIKTFGNIVCFRNLEEATNECMALFGDPEARGVTILRTFEEYFFGYTDGNGKHVTGYKESVEELKSLFQPGENPVGEKAEKNFIALFGSILKMRNLLSCFDQFCEVEKELGTLSEREVQDYTSVYLDLADKYRHQNKPKEDICDDVVFEMELVKQVEVNIDFILFLVDKYRDSHKADLEIRSQIIKSINSSPDLRNKKELIEQFLENLQPNGDVEEQWKAYVNQQKRLQFDIIIKEEKLKRDKALSFIENAFMRGFVPEGGMELDGIMPPINPFDKDANRLGRCLQILDRIKEFFSRFYGIANNDFAE